MIFHFVAGQYNPEAAEWFVFGVVYADKETSKIIVDYGPFTSKEEAEECANEADAMKMLAFDTKAVTFYPSDNPTENNGPPPFTVIDGGK